MAGPACCAKMDIGVKPLIRRSESAMVEAEAERRKRGFPCLVPFCDPFPEVWDDGFGPIIGREEGH
jgi:hypothetical protein